MAYKMLRPLGRKEINRLAEKRTLNHIKHGKAEDYVQIFENGALNYFKMKKYQTKK